MLRIFNFPLYFQRYTVLQKPHSCGLHLLNANHQIEVRYEMNEISLPSIENHFYHYNSINMNSYEYWEYLISSYTLNNTLYKRNLFLNANHQSEVPYEMNETSLPSVEYNFYHYNWGHLNIRACLEYLIFPRTLNNALYSRNLTLLVCIS